MADVNERNAARLAAVQALYQMELSGKGINDTLAEFEAFWIGQEVEGLSFQTAEKEFFHDLLGGTVREQALIDPAIDAALSKGWPLKRIEAVLRAILRAGAYELMFRKDVPARVAIFEYVEIAHDFFDGDETGMVNAVLDHLARKLREDEIKDFIKPAKA